MIEMGLVVRLTCDNEWTDKSRTTNRRRACIDDIKHSVTVFDSIDSAKVKSDAEEIFKAEGWVILPDGKGLCPTCAINGMGKMKYDGEDD